MNTSDADIALSNQFVASRDNFIRKFIVPPSNAIADPELGKWLLGCSHRLEPERMADTLKELVFPAPRRISEWKLLSHSERLRKQRDDILVLFDRLSEDHQGLERALEAILFQLNQEKNHGDESLIEEGVNLVSERICKKYPSWICKLQKYLIRPASSIVLEPVWNLGGKSFGDPAVGKPDSNLDLKIQNSDIFYNQTRVVRESDYSKTRLGDKLLITIVTGWVGDLFKDIADLTVPLIEKYAIKHGMKLVCGDLSGERPSSWNKIPLIEKY